MTMTTTITLDGSTAFVSITQTLVLHPKLKTFSELEKMRDVRCHCFCATIIKAKIYPHHHQNSRHTFQPKQKRLMFQWELKDSPVSNSFFFLMYYLVPWLYERFVQSVALVVDSFTTKASARLKFKLFLIVLLLPTSPSPFLIIAANSA